MKPFFFSLVMLIASPAWAGWEEVTRGSSSGNVFYIDPATIRKEGNRRKVWAITDLNKAGSLGELSRKIRKEFDCKDERYRFLSISAHSKSMGSGDVLRVDNTVSEWQEVAPETVDEVYLNRVCGK